MGGEAGARQARLAPREREERQELIREMVVDVASAPDPLEQLVDRGVGDRLGRQAAPAERREPGPPPDGEEQQGPRAPRALVLLDGDVGKRLVRGMGLAQLP